MRTIQERFEAKFTKAEGCWEWRAFKNSKGYGALYFNGRQRLAHRVAYQLYVGEIPAGLCVCHRCDNRGCVNPTHLFLGTQADNVHDCEDKGRDVHPFGEKHGRSKLTNEQIIEIRARHSDGAQNVDLAKEFGVSQPTISMIVCGHTWTRIYNNNVE